MNRTKFFKTISTAFIGTIAGLSIPFVSNKFFKTKGTGRISVKINPLAVKREKKSSKNG